MSRYLSLVAGLGTVVAIFAIGFSGSEVRIVDSPRLSTPAPASLGGAGGSSFWWVESVSPALSERATAAPEEAGCRPLSRLIPPCEETEPGTLVGVMAGLDRWRPLVARYFRPEDVDLALEVIGCESHGNPRAANPTSTARGLFQHLASMWPERAAKAGWPDADIFDPEANVAVAAWLVYEGGGWDHWNASAHCW